MTRFVQKSKDLTNLVISFKAIDLQSGVLNVYWAIEQSTDESIIATDTVPIDMMTPVSYIPYTLRRSSVT